MHTEQIDQTQDALIKSLLELIRKTRTDNQPAPLDAKQVQQVVDSAVEAAFRGFKIGKDNMGAELLEFLNSHKPIKIELPTGQVVNVPDAALIPSFLKIVDDLTVGNNVYLYGDAGTGKTTLAKSVAKALNRDFVTINCNQFTSPIQIIGGQTIEGYRQGALIEAWINGKMLILDELPKMDPNTAGVLNDALANSDQPEGTIIFDGQGDPQPKHKNFCVVATGNTTGKGTSPRYVGNNKLDLSLIDRFQGSYYEIGFNDRLEKALTFSKVWDICARIREQLRVHNADEIMTLRTMLNLDRIYQVEMERMLGSRPNIPNGKTLRDSLDSYFAIMNPDKAMLIRESIDYEMFVSTYRDVKAFRSEYEKRRVAA